VPLQIIYTSSLTEACYTASTNDVTADFRNYLLSNTPVMNNQTDALAVITRSAQALVSDLMDLIPAQGVAPDFLILPVVPLEDTPIMRVVAKDLNASTAVCKLVTERFNTVLMEGAAQIATQLGSRGNVFTYDIPSLIHTMVQQPQEYGITNVTAGCSQWGCQNATTYIFW
jgi:phospholipase/lecithinase/hemolysin